jgi:hypothetical protein
MFISVYGHVIDCAIINIVVTHVTCSKVVFVQKKKIPSFALTFVVVMEGLLHMVSEWVQTCHIGLLRLPLC